MYNWDQNVSESKAPRNLNLIIFVGAAITALILFLVFHPQIKAITTESPIILNLMFGPAMAIGFLYGSRITERAIKPSEIRSPVKRSIIKIFLFFFVIGGLFSSVSFAINGGSIMPQSSLLDAGLLQWGSDFISANGGATFLIVTSVMLMAAATKRIVGLGGPLNKILTFTGTFVFFSMLALSFTQNDPSSSEVFLFTFYQAGIVGGALFEMNKLTRNQNSWDDFANGF